MDTKELVVINALRDTEIFTGLADGELAEISKKCYRRNYQVGEHCTIQGMASDELQILNDGKVAVELHIEVAPFARTLRIGTLTKGHMLDFSTFCEPHAPTTSAICLDRAETICIKAVDLTRIFQENQMIENKVMKNLVQIMSTRYRASRIQLARLVSEMVEREKQ
ncbi:MAG: hypothetical protein A2Y92_01615 [Chloroflexi bacterium RBG_13_57_8]|nr:MAG: hypothetical protein A2Y92_01615 [Chloroflexi bacterium RBG_13_57_8]